MANKRIISFSGLTVAAGIVAGTATTLGFLGSLHWFWDLLSHFRVQYFFGLFGVAVILLALRRRLAAAIFGALALVNLGVILPLYWGGDTAPPAGIRPVRVMLANVHRANRDFAAVAAAVRRFAPDMVVLEEVDERWLAELEPAMVGYRCTKEPRTDNFGLAFFSKFPVIQAKVIYIGGAEVPSIMAEVETPQGRVTVLATHPLPPLGREYSRWRNEQLAKLPRWVRGASSPVLLLGDLNCSPWSPSFSRLLRESGLKDSARGRGVQPTWPSNNFFLRIPLDHCLYSPAITVVRREVGPAVGSDHFPLIVDFVRALE